MMTLPTPREAAEALFKVLYGFEAFNDNGQAVGTLEVTTIEAAFAARDRALLKPNLDDWERAALVCREVAELPDRDSPSDNPDIMLVTGDELQPIVAAGFASLRRVLLAGDEATIEVLREALEYLQIDDDRYRNSYNKPDKPTTWFVIDTRKAEPEVNWAGELVEQCGSYREAEHARIRAALTALRRHQGVAPECDHHWIGGNDGLWCTICKEEKS